MAVYSSEKVSKGKVSDILSDIISKKDSWIRDSHVIVRAAKKIRGRQANFLKDSQTMFGAMKAKYSLYARIVKSQNAVFMNRDIHSIHDQNGRILSSIQKENMEKVQLEHFIGLFLEECNHDYAEVEGVLYSIGEMIDEDDEFDSAPKSAIDAVRKGYVNQTGTQSWKKGGLVISFKYPSVLASPQGRAADKKKEQYYFLDYMRAGAIKDNLKRLCSLANGQLEVYNGFKELISRYSEFLQAQDIEIDEVLRSGANKEVSASRLKYEEEIMLIREITKRYVDLTNAVVKIAKEEYADVIMQKKLTSTILASKKGLGARSYDTMLWLAYFLRRPVFESVRWYKGAFDLIDSLLYPFPSHSFAGNEDPWILWRDNVMSHKISQFAKIEIFSESGSIPSLMKINSGYKINAKLAYQPFSHKDRHAMGATGKNMVYGLDFEKCLRNFIGVTKDNFLNPNKSRSIYGTNVYVFLVKESYFNFKKAREFYRCMGQSQNTHVTTLRMHADDGTLTLRPSEDEFKYGFRKLVTLAYVTRKRDESISQRYARMIEKELGYYIGMMSERYLGVLISDIINLRVGVNTMFGMPIEESRFGHIFIGSYVPDSIKWSVALSECSLLLPEESKPTDMISIAIRYMDGTGDPRKAVYDFYGRENIYELV